MRSRRPSETAWNLLGGLTAPIFRGGTLSAERRAAKADYQAAFAAYQQTVLNAFSQVADSLQALGNDADSLSTQQRAVESSRASLTLTRQAYVAGDAGYVRVLDAVGIKDIQTTVNVFASAIHGATLMVDAGWSAF